MKTRVAFMLVLWVVLVFQIAVQSGAVGMSSSPEEKVTSVKKLDRSIKLEIVVNAPVERVWQAWTTREGIRSFFAPDCDIDVRVLGKYDILFAPTAPAGLRGAEGNLILAIQEGKMLSFTWDAPPSFPDVRKQRTSVVIRLAQLEQNRTKLTFTQSGWGEGDEWNKAYDYFVGAWKDVVLPLLKHSLEVGPVSGKTRRRSLRRPP